MMVRVTGFSRPTIAVSAVGSLLAAVTIAAAQPRTRSTHATKPRGAVSADGGGDEGATVVAASPEAGPPIMPAPAAPVSAPAPDERGDGGRLSPLNPAADEFSDAGAVSAPADYDHLLADIAALRARIAAVSDTLFHSRIAIGLRVSGDHARIASLSVSIDDGQVWSSPASFRAEAETTVYDHAVAPGHHAVTVDVERRDDRNDTFRSAQRSRFIVDVPSDRRLSVQLDLADDSNVARDFPADGDGRYDLRIRAHVKADSVPR